MKPLPKGITLPKGIIESDTQTEKWKKGDRYQGQFELWFTQRFGWCMPTLDISGARRGQDTRRSYGVKLEGDIKDSVVTMGSGPHILATVVVYVRESRKDALQPFLERRTAGLAVAGEIRDRISTRRANTIARRGSGGFGLW